MENLALIIYGINVLHSAACLLTSVSILSGIAIVGGIIAVLATYDTHHEEDKLMSKKFLKTSAWIFSLSALVLILTPSKDTSYAMLAAVGVNEIVKSETVSELGGKSLKVLETYLDSLIEKPVEAK